VRLLVSQISRTQFIAVAQPKPRDEHHVAPCTRVLFIAREPPQEVCPPGQISCDRCHFPPRTSRGKALAKDIIETGETRHWTLAIFGLVQILAS
jgi:hypothetical protein